MIIGRKPGALFRGPQKDEPLHRPRMGLSRLSPRDWRPFLPSWVYDQLGESSCTANALGHVVAIVNAAAGVVDAPPVSRNAGYYWGRKYDGLEKEDGGGFISSMFIVAEKFGLPSEAAWPYDEARVNDEPPLSVLHNAADGRWTSGWGHVSPGSVALDEALSHGPVELGLELFHNFGALQPGEVYRRKPSTGKWGGHAFVIVHVLPTGDYVCRNSWGASFCDAGNFILSRDEVDQADAGDAIVAYAAPVPEAA